MSGPDYFESSSNRLEQCFKRLSVVTSVNDDQFQQELNKLLDDLNSCGDCDRNVDNEIVKKVLCRCVLCVPLGSEHLVTKFCPLIIHFTRRLKIPLGKETLSLLIEYLVRVLQRCSSWVHPYALLALSALLYANVDQVEEYWDQLVGPNGLLISLATSDDLDISQCSLKCLENLTLRNAVGDYLLPSHIRRCLETFMDRLKSLPTLKQVDDFVQCKILVSCLSGIQNLIFGAKMTDIPCLGELLAVLKFYAFYNVPGYSQLPLVNCLYPSPLSQNYFQVATSSLAPADVKPATKTSSSRIWKSHRRRSANKKQKEPVEAARNEDSSATRGACRSDGEGSPRRGCETRYPSPRSKISSSESEYSDTEGGNAAHLYSAQSKVRQAALGTLLAVVKTVDRKVVFGYWSSFLPDSPSSTGTLTSCLLKDPAPKVRNATLVVLVAMLEGSKQFLSLAGEREKIRPAFTTLSFTLASTIHELHRSLILALVAESSALVLIQIVKCIAVLVQAAPVHKLASGFLSRIAKQLQPLLRHSDLNVRVAALTAFGSILAIHPPLEEVSEILRWNTSREEQQMSPAARRPPVSWLAKLCLANAASASRDTGKLVPLPVRLESLQVLGGIAKEYFTCLRPSLADAVDVVQTGLADAEVSVRLHSGKLLEELGRSSSKECSTRETAVDECVLSSDDVANLWTTVLSTSLPSLLQDVGHPILLAKGCDCISTISSSAFSLLQRSLQIMCQTFLLGLGSDEDKNVKGAATRALGVLVLYPALREDVSFVIDVSEKASSAVDDQNLEVRFKAAWTLANVTDALVLNKDSAIDDFVAELPDGVLLRLAKASLKMTRDNDRARSNGVRALGNLLRYLGQRHLEQETFKKLIPECIQALVKCASTDGNMKVRWNTCYALGNMLHNGDLADSSMPCRSLVFDALSLAAKECKNFKVRINAAIALKVPSTRDMYGTSTEMAELWLRLVSGLGNIKSAMDFVEYQHHDNLVHQVCLVMCHLAALFGAEDAVAISSRLHTEDYEAALSYLGKHVSHLAVFREVRDETTEMTVAKQNLKRLSADSHDRIQFVEDFILVLESGDIVEVAKMQ